MCQLYLFTIINVSCQECVGGFRHFSFFHETMLFSLVFFIFGECNIQSSLEKPSPLGPSYIQSQIQEDTWLVLGTHFL